MSRLGYTQKWICHYFFPAGGSARVVEVQRSPSQPQQFSTQQQQQQQYRYEYQTQYNQQQQNNQPQNQFNQQQNQFDQQQNLLTQQPQPLQFSPPAGQQQYNQQEYSTQQRQYTQQRYNTQQQDGALHVDTSPKMLSTGGGSSHVVNRSPAR